MARGLPHFFFMNGYWWCRAGNSLYGGWSRLPFGELLPPRG